MMNESITENAEEYASKKCRDIIGTVTVILDTRKRSGFTNLNETIMPAVTKDGKEIFIPGVITDDNSYSCYYTDNYKVFKQEIKDEEKLESEKRLIFIREDDLKEDCEGKISPEKFISVNVNHRALAPERFVPSNFIENIEIQFNEYRPENKEKPIREHNNEGPAKMKFEHRLDKMELGCGTFDYWYYQLASCSFFIDGEKIDFAHNLFANIDRNIEKTEKLLNNLIEGKRNLLNKVGLIDSSSGLVVKQSGDIVYNCGNHLKQMLPTKNI